MLRQVAPSPWREGDPSDVAAVLRVRHAPTSSPAIGVLSVMFPLDLKQLDGRLSVRASMPSGRLPPPSCSTS